MLVGQDIDKKISEFIIKRSEQTENQQISKPRNEALHTTENRKKNATRHSRQAHGRNACTQKST